MRFRFIEAEKACYPIRILCRCLEVSRSGCYAWRGRMASARAQEDARLKVKIAAWHRASHGTCGSWDSATAEPLTPLVDQHKSARPRLVGK